MKFVRDIGNIIRENKLLAIILLLLVGMSFKIDSMTFPVIDFSNTILSMASSKNIDIGHLIQWYYLYAIPLCFLFAYALWRSSLLKEWLSTYQLSVQNLPTFKFIKERNEFLFVILALFWQIIAGKRDWISISVSITIVLFLVLAWKYRDKDLIDKLMIGIEAFIAFCIPVFFMGLYIGWKFSILLFLASLIMGYYFYLTSKIFSLSKIIREIHIFLWAAALDTLLMYMCEILLVRGYPVNVYWLLFPYVIACIYCWITKNKKYSVEINWIYPILFMLGMMSIPVLGREIQIDFFEGANHGLSIQEFIYGWGIPIFNNLDAHLLSNTVSGLLYWELTNDYEGALFAPYSNTITNLIGVFSLNFILCKFFDKKYVLILLFLFPWNAFEILYPGLIAIVVFLWWKKQNNWVSDISVILLFIILCFYRIDIGASFGIALITLPLAYNFLNKNYKRSLQYAANGILIAVITLLGCYSIAQYEQVNFIHLIESFLTAFSSNQHWGYGDLGTKKYSYWYYFILPVLITSLVFPYLQKIKKYCENDSVWIILFFYLTYLLNWPRALVRHTMVERSAATYAIPILLLFFIIVLLWKKHQEGLEKILFTGLRNLSTLSSSVKLATILGGILLLGGILMMPHHKLSAISQFPNLYHAMDAIYRQEHVLYKIDENDRRQIQELKSFFDSYLRPNETYFDFSNQSLFFAFTNRKNPIYINQCPGMINGKKGQLQALQELKKENVSFVLMPYKTRNIGSYGASISLDGVLNVDRYYILFEYIAQNYRPFCRVGDFAIWCKKSDYVELLKKDQLTCMNREYLTYTYGSKQMHEHDLGAIPYLWGQFASAEDEKGRNINLQNNGIFWDISKDIIGRPGFIVLTIQAANRNTASLNLYGEAGQNISYTFNVMQGIGQYRLRVSSDILWYSDLINKMTLNTNGAMVKAIVFQDMEESI